MNSRPPPVRHPSSPQLGHNVVAIASGKGGVGKTWFSITLSQALAQAGGRVLLFDGDLGLANIDIQLGLTGKRDLGDVMAGRIPLRGAVTEFTDGRFDDEGNSMAHDIVIRGGQLVDGTGSEPVPGDLAIDDGLITAMGKVDEKCKREIDADGCRRKQSHRPGRSSRNGSSSACETLSSRE